MPLFNRDASLLIGPSGNIGIKIEGLRITFKIKKNNKPETNTAEIEIFNLRKETRDKFQKGDLLILNAGYVDHVGLENVFVGNIENIFHVHEGADIISKLECKDGSNTLRTSKISVSYGEGTKAKDILRDVVNLILLPNKYIDWIAIQDKEYVNKFVYAGKASGALTKLADYLDFEWSIQDNALQILKRGGSNKKETILLSPSTGLIGSPEKINIQEPKEEKEENKKKRPGWKLNCLLIPKVSIGGIVSVESAEIKKGSFFRIVNIDHSGDTFSNDWNTTLEVEEKKFI